MNKQIGWIILTTKNFKKMRLIKPPMTQPWGQRTAYSTDPDGHIWELQQWVKK